MALFATQELLDTHHVYGNTIKGILLERLEHVIQPLEYNIENINILSNFHVALDIQKIANTLMGGCEFGNYLEKERDPLEFIQQLAKEYGTCVMPAVAFAGPFWGIRICLASLPSDAYILVGNNIRSLIDMYYEQFKEWERKEQKKTHKEAKKKLK